MFCMEYLPKFKVVLAQDPFSPCRHVEPQINAWIPVTVAWWISNGRECHLVPTLQMLSAIRQELRRYIIALMRIPLHPKNLHTHKEI